MRAPNTDYTNDEQIVKIDTVPDSIVKTDTVPLSTWDLQDAKCILSMKSDCSIDVKGFRFFTMERLFYALQLLSLGDRKFIRQLAKYSRMDYVRKCVNTRFELASTALQDKWLDEQFQTWTQIITARILSDPVFKQTLLDSAGSPLCDPDEPVYATALTSARKMCVQRKLLCWPTWITLPTRVMTASPITLRACIPAPDQVTPERAYFKDLDFYKNTLLHTPFLTRGRAVTFLEYRDAKIVFEVDNWFNQLPQAVQRYLLPLQSMYAKWYDQNVPDLTQNYSYCALCKNKQTNLQRHRMQHHARWRTIWFCPIPGCPSSLANKEGLVKHLQSRPHGRGVELHLGRRVAKEIANQNCFWPVTQVMADKLLSASKRLIRYIALYSMAGVAMENRLFRIHPNARDTPYMDACAAFLTPKMSLSQVMPSGCHLRRFAQPPANQLAVADRPSASDYPEVEESIDPEDMRMAVTTPVFQPYRGETGRAWVAKEYGVTMDTSSIMSSETEREDTDDEVCSFDLGPAPYDPSGQERIPSDEWLDDYQQGLQPGSSEPRPDPYDRYLTMPIRPSILDMIHSDVEKNEPDPPPPRERALTPTIRWDFDYTRDEPPVVQRLAEAPRHSTPRPDPKTPSERPRPALELPRPRASSAPPTSHPAKRVALQYLPVTEEITPPITPPRAQTTEMNTATETVPETPSPVQK